ncbi:MAG: HD-GYP domain-containing protein [Planctomycetota bacterium]|jgi:HD-GYP domain-containing protein (c-di-GMP phosphodiesterase class II)
MAQNFIPIPVSSIPEDADLDFDLYRCYGSGKSRTHVLAFPRHIPITPEARFNLDRQEIEILYLAGKDADIFRSHIEQNLDRILRQSNFTTKDKAKVLYLAAGFCIRDMFNDPRIGPALESNRDILRHIIRHVSGTPKAFHNFFDLGSDSYYLFTHALNVAIYGIALLSSMGDTKAETLINFGFGALVHDLGMREIPSSIILKPDRLTEDEYKVVRKHPWLGADIADRAGGIPQHSHVVVIQHHERLDGAGYPWASKASDIHPLARLCAVVDAFDALTSPRSYKSPVSTYDAFRIMKTDGYRKFDQAYVDAFIRLMSR